MKRLVALAVLALALCGVATAASPPARLPEGARLGMLRVPRLGINVRVLQGAMNLYTQDWPSTLNGGPSHYPDTSLPWQYGTVGIAGHRVTHTHPFLHLDRMRRGDLIYLKTRFGTYVYRVYRVRVVAPDALWILNGRKIRRLVLTACNPAHFATSRIAVFALLIR